MEIRLLTENDWLQWKELRLTALLKSPEAFGSSYQEEVSKSEEELKLDIKTNNIFGYFIEKKLVASVGIFQKQGKKQKHKGIIYAVYTDPEYRGQGIASKLLDAAIKYGKTKVTHIYLTCTTINLSALNLYQKFGFKIYGTEPYSLKIENNFYDEHLLVLELN